VPFGVVLAPILFQGIMDTMLQEIPNTICYLDDILVTGKNDEDRCKNLEEVLKQLQASGLKSKCAIIQESVGDRIDAHNT